MPRGCFRIILLCLPSGTSVPCAFLPRLSPFEKAGVLLDANDDSTVIPTINPSRYEQLKSKQKIFAGMIPKLDNAFAAINYGVKKVTIGKAEELEKLINGEAGTNILNE